MSKQVVGLKKCFFFFFNVTALIPKALGNNGKIFLCEATDLMKLLCQKTLTIFVFLKQLETLRLLSGVLNVINIQVTF